MTAPATEVTVRAEYGFRGARLGPPFEFQWTDQVPSGKTWKDVSQRRGCLWAAIGVPGTWFVGYLLAREGGFSLAVLLSMISAFMFHGVGLQRCRGDDEPVPKPVHREAWIEHTDDGFFFAVAVDGKALIWQPWDLVQQFERVDYWPMFGDAGASPYKTSYHAIIMTPAVGKPWLVGATIESMSEVRHRFTTLDSRFSAEARRAFLRQVEASKTKPERGTTTSPAGSVPDTL
jgi:hypothetical protein